MLEMTKYQETLRFNEANADERRQIYTDIGFEKPSVILGLNEKSAEMKRDGIDATGIFHGQMTKIKEIFCDYTYSYLLHKKIEFEAYSDFEEMKDGWPATVSSDTVFYFFRDAIVSTEITQIRDVIAWLREEHDMDAKLSKMVPVFIEHGVRGKKIEDVDGVELYIRENGDGHHSVGFVVETESLPDYLMDITEYYFEEEEPEKDPEPQEEQ